MSDSPGGHRQILIGGIIGGVIGAAIAVAVAIVVLGHGRSGHDAVTAVPTSTTTTKAPLTGPAADMIRLLSKGSTTDYHAKYTVSSTQVPNPGASVTVELWRRPPDVRQDTVAVEKSSTSDTASFQTASGVLDCARQGSLAWTCQPASTADTGLANPDQLSQLATSQLAGATVTVHPATIRSTAATCFDVVKSGEKTEICVNSAGIPLRFSSEGTELTLTLLDTALPADLPRRLRVRSGRARCWGGPLSQLVENLAHHDESLRWRRR